MDGMQEQYGRVGRVSFLFKSSAKDLGALCLGRPSLKTAPAGGLGVRCRSRKGGITGFVLGLRVEVSSTSKSLVLHSRYHVILIIIGSKTQSVKPLVHLSRISEAEEMHGAASERIASRAQAILRHILVRSTCHRIQIHKQGALGISQHLLQRIQVLLIAKEGHSTRLFRDLGP